MLAAISGMAIPQTGTVWVTSPQFATLSNNFSYSISITNNGPGAATINLVSTFSPSLQFVTATSNDNVTVSASANRVEFVVRQLLATSNTVLSLTLRPTQTGTVTNRFAVTVGNFTTATNTSTLISEVPGNADVAVTLTPPSVAPILVNDWVVFNVGLVNRGGGTVSGIFLTNTFTAPMQVRGFRPSAGGSVAQNPTRVIFNVGALAAGQTTNYVITVQPAAATNFTVTSNFRFSGNADTNSLNNVTNRNINVVAPGTNQLIAAIASTQQFNPQNAYMEQLIVVTNTGPTVAPNARVILSNITYQVANAVGTNNGHPFVLHAAPIQPTETVELLLEYIIPSREPRPSPGLIPYSTTELAPRAIAGGTMAEFTHVVWREPHGAMTESNLVLIFRSEPNARYELQYSSSIAFTNALRALPLIVAPANNTVWIDYGPPKTVSRPLREVTFTTNVTLSNVSQTNEFYSTNDMGAIATNTVVTNFVAFRTNSVTNLNMRFYRAMRLP